MNRPILNLILLALALKVVLTFGVVKKYRLNWDESSAWTVADNKLAGHGYSLYNETIGEYRLTAFHGTFTVLLYEQLIRLHISRQAWEAFMHFVTLFLFAGSILYFYRLCCLFLFNETIRKLCVITYAFYPSVQYYIGSLLLYENFTTSLLIIFLYRFILAQRLGFNLCDFIVLPLTLAISCLFRPQLIVVYGIFLFIILLITQHRKPVFFIGLLSFACMLLGFIPSLQKNKKLFGAYILSTQSGFELLQGHNPTARGSWMHHWEEKGNPVK
jgi:hypothetical protein